MALRRAITAARCPLSRWYSRTSAVAQLASDSVTAPAPSYTRPAPREVVSNIVEALSQDSRDDTHILAVLCDDESGVLSRVVGTLSARGFNIDSLTVSPTNIPDLSRMTIVMKGVSDPKIQQALKQLSDIVNVWACVNYTGTNSIARELVMVKVAYLGPTGDYKLDAAQKAPVSYAALLSAQPHRAAVRDIGALFGAEVVDVGSRHITFQLTSWSRRIDAFIRMLEPWGIIEVARSGVVAMLRSPVSGTESDRIGTPKAQSGMSAAEAAALPPG